MNVQKRPDCVAIVSGGMDSVTLLHYLVKTMRRQPAVITFTYGQKHIKEVSFAQENAQILRCTYHLICDLSGVREIFRTSALVASDINVPTIEEVRGDSQPATYVPNRNMIFLSLAAAFAESHGATEVFYGAQRHDLYGYWDTTQDFLSRLNDTFALNRKMTIRIDAPFVNYSKAEILRHGLTLGVDYAKTWSCYEGQSLACGVCPTCAERVAAFAEVGVLDPLQYRPTK
jgi:7-cyano-7-deazaguanine synthase